MKHLRLLLLLPVVLLLTGSVTNSMLQVVAKKNAGGGAPSSTKQDEHVGPADGSVNFGMGSDTVRMAGYFVAGATYTATSVKVSMRKTGSPTFNITAEIREHGSSAPGTLIDTSDAISATTLTTGEVIYEFTGLEASIVSGNTYWISLTLSAYDGWSNYVWVYYVSGDYPGYSMIQKGTATPTWASQTNNQFVFEIWGY